MPRAHDYREAASWLRHLDARVAHDWARVRLATDPSRIVGGPTRSLIEGSFDAVDVEVARARVELERLARICDRRAEICADFTSDLLRGRPLVTTTGVAGAPPTPPAGRAAP